MKKYILVLAICCSFHGIGSKLSAAFEALSIYDYFKARSLFYATLSKHPAEASYGLATIYYRTDNPFSNIDSAARYIYLGTKSVKDTLAFSGFTISPGSVAGLARQICIKGYRQYAAHHTVCDFNYFLEHFFFSGDSLIENALTRRDQLAFDRCLHSASSDSIRLFLERYPESRLYDSATTAYYALEYAEQTRNYSAAEYKRFIINYPQNPNVNDAENRLFQLTAKLHNADSLYAFIRHYSKRNRAEAWRMLYSTVVLNASAGELRAFLAAYPDYPYREDIEKEIEWSKQVLYVVKAANERYGYTDTTGAWIIAPVYDDASPFHEGFAAVCKNDSCYFINKSGNKNSAPAEEVFDYHNGIAIIKKQNRYYLLNRSGQIISKPYEDISPQSDGLFVARQNGLYGALNAKAETVIPFVYKKLGTFRNGYAYYISDLYGLVSTGNRKLEARWDWISEIDTNGLVIVKKNKQFGLMDLNERLLLQPEWDYINHCTGQVYLVVRNDLYGFYDAGDRCYISDVAYDYERAYSNAYYTNGRQFKLREEDEIALMDANGRISIPFGHYTDVFFAKDDVIRIQKGKKYGYVDRKLKAITSTDYDKASDFDNQVAIVSKGGGTQLINRSGKPVFTVKDGNIEHGRGRLYKATVAGTYGLVDASGEILLPIEYLHLELLDSYWWRAAKDKQIFLYNARTKTLKELND